MNVPEPETSAAAFSEWMRREGLTIRGARDVLGISKSTVEKYKKQGGPKWLGLACAAVSGGVKPVE